ncbi:hypothetical protein JCM3775_000391 [Rhodotorula graminis]
MRVLALVTAFTFIAAVVSTTSHASVASPGEDASTVEENPVSTSGFVKGQRSLEKRTLCGTDSDCQLVASLLPILYPNGARCSKWLCVPKCGDLWDWDIFSHKCRDVSSDTDNCGKCGQKCTLPGATQTTCEHGVCSLNPSQHARIKRSVSAPRRKLCPAVNEQACPILGSSTYAEAVKHHFEANGELSGVMSGVGGFDVGCESSRCVVLSCDAGWRPSRRGDKCVRVRSSFLPAKNATTHASHTHLRAGMRHSS